MPESSSHPAGLLLLTGGQGRRLGGPKHLQPHSDASSWGRHLVEVFETSFPGCPMLLLGEPLPDRPDLSTCSDPRQGPAVALRHWAATPQPVVERWWVVACDQVRWTPQALEAWHRKATAADPACAYWVLASHGGRTQFLGSWLAGSLQPALAALRTPSLWSLSEALPCLLLEETGAEWQDVDTPEALSAWLDPKAPG